MPEAYKDAFWWGFLIVSALGLFWWALRDDAREILRDSHPTDDTTKTRRLP